MAADPPGSLPEKLRQQRTGSMVEGVEAAALELFAERGFAAVTVDQIAAAAGISVRTFYRYFPTKEDVLQVQVDRRSAAVAAALGARPPDEAPLRSLRLGLAAALGTEDPALTRRWTEVVSDNPEVVKGVIGGIVLKTQRTIGEFLAVRLDLPSGSLVPTTLAAAATGILQSGHTRWFLEGGDLAEHVADGVAVLEQGLRTDPGTWPQHR